MTWAHDTLGSDAVQAKMHDVTSQDYTRMAGSGTEQVPQM